MQLFQSNVVNFSKTIFLRLAFFYLCLWLVATPNLLWAKTSAQDFLMACYLGTVEEVEQGILAGADVNAVSPQRHTPLTAAVLGQTDSFEKVEVLLKAKADPSIKGGGQYTQTPLRYALSDSQDLNLIKLLLEAEAEINSKGRSTPVSVSLLQVCLFSMSWADQEQALLLKEFLKQGADINQQNERGGTALLQCARHSGPESLKVLLKAGAEIDAVGTIYGTALHNAAIKSSYPENIILLLDHGANPAQRNRQNKTPLELAQNNPTPGAPHIQAILHSPENRGQWKISDPPTIDDLVLLSHSGTAQEVKRAIIAGSVDVNSLSKQGFTPLVTAVASQMDNLEKVDLLLKAKANPNLQDKFGSTPLYKAVAQYRSNSLEVMERLIEAKADVNASSTSWQSLFKVAAMGAEEPVNKFLLSSFPQWPPDQHAKLLKFLLEKGADVDKYDLIAASDRAGPESLRILIETGLDVNIFHDWWDLSTLLTAIINPNPESIHVGNGYSALLAAAEYNPYPESIRVLLDAGADPNFECSTQKKCNVLHLAEMNTTVAAEHIKGILREAVNKHNK